MRFSFVIWGVSIWIMFGCSKEVNGITCWVCQNEIYGKDFHDHCPGDVQDLVTHNVSQMECPALVTQCAFGMADGTTYSRRDDAYCDGTYGETYPTLYEAQNACSQDPNCAMIADRDCNTASYQKCKGPIEDRGYETACTYIKVGYHMHIAKRACGEELVVMDNHCTTIKSKINGMMDT